MAACGRKIKVTLKANVFMFNSISVIFIFIEMTLNVNAR
ncbi:putative membrane protein [Serratia plymuthica A30]|nr:putative membrane protein [Serratia plymuthica A30]